MLLICLKIFIVRIIDVSLGTIRTLFVVKGQKLTAAFIGFFETLIWFLIVKEALNIDVSSIFIAISYSLGFATGTYLGSFLSNLYIKEKIVIEVFTSNITLENKVREKGYAVSSIECRGYKDNIKKMLYILIDKKRENKLRNIIEKNDSDAFIVESNINFVKNGYFNKK